MTTVKQPTESGSPESAVIALLLCVFFGIFGAHRFYVGKIKSGLIMLFTLGGFGLWMIADTIMIACSEFQDEEGRTLLLTSGGEPRNKLILGIAAIFTSFFIYIVALYFLVAWFFTDAVTGVVYAELRAIRNGDLERAYQYNSDDFRTATSYDVFKQFINNFAVIKNNEGITITSHDVDQNGIGSVDGVVYSEDDSMPIEYNLVKEGGSYKILNIKVKPATGNNNAEADTSSVSSAAAETAPAHSMTYNDTEGNYSIDYPSNWFYENSTKYSTVFSGKKGTPAYVSTVTVQVIPMERAGGIYNSAKAVVDDLKNQIEKETTDIKFIREGTAVPPVNAKKLTGRYFEVTYNYKGIAMKKMQYIIVTPDKRTAYSWGYTTTAARYDTDLPIAEAMYASWKIH